MKKIYFVIREAVNWASYALVYRQTTKIDSPYCQHWHDNIKNENSRTIMADKGLACMLRSTAFRFSFTMR